MANLATHSYSGGHAEDDEIAVERAAYDPDGDPDTEELDVSTFENVTGSMHNDRLTGDHRLTRLRAATAMMSLLVVDNPDGRDPDTDDPPNDAMPLSYDSLAGGKGDDAPQGWRWPGSFERWSWCRHDSTVESREARDAVLA